MLNRTFTINGVRIHCKRIPKQPFVVATIADKQAKFTIYGNEVTLIEGEVPELILEGLLKNISNYFSNNLIPAI